MWLDLSGEVHEVKYQTREAMIAERITKICSTEVSARCLICIETGARIEYADTNSGWVLSVTYTSTNSKILHTYGNEHEAITGLESLSKSLSAQVFPAV